MTLNTASLQPVPFEERAVGIDVSRYQGIIDFDAIALSSAPEFHYVGIRATVGSVYQDGYFQNNWKGFLRSGLLRTAYGVIRPNEPYIPQMENLLRTVGKDLGELPLTLDEELDLGASQQQITDFIFHSNYWLQVRTGRAPLHYSRAEWINRFTSAGYWRSSLDWWLAQYTRLGSEYRGPVALPQYVKTYRILQSTSKGRPVGVQSKSLDYNRWNGRVADVYAFAGMAYSAPTPVVKTIPVKITVPLRNLRSGPGINYPTKGYKTYGQVVELEIDTGTWGRLVDGKWMWTVNGIQRL